MLKKILLGLVLLSNISIYSQKILNTPQSSGTVVDAVSITMQPGFSFSSLSGEFIAKIGSGNTASVPTNPPTNYTPISVTYSNTFDSSENYIYTREYLVPVTTTTESAQQIQGIQFFDGLGRPKQAVSIKSTSTGKDLVTRIPYDGFGRQVDSWLPVPLDTKNGDIHADNDVVSGASSTYSDSYAFAHKELESSPLDRVLQQKQPGTDWQTKPITFDYFANDSLEVKKYITTTTWGTDGATTSTLSQTVTYGKNQLYKNKVTDEDGNVSYEFKNGQGQTLLVRKELDASTKADTYYVYNEYDQLAFVIPPLASKINTLLPDDISQLLYQYRYDGQNRLLEKKLPGKGWEFMVYDNQDRLVATQDAELKKKNQWLFTKYDPFGRVVYTGLKNVNKSRADYQADVNAKGTNNESRDATGFDNFTQKVYYTNNNAYPTVVDNTDKILSINYYDTYPTGTPTVTSSISGQDLLTDTYTTFTVNGINSVRSTKGLPVASYVKNIEDNSWTKSYTFYETKARPVITYSQNHLGGYTKTESKLMFSGKPEYTITTHKRSTAASDAVVTIKDTFVYDHQERLVQHKHQINGGTEVLLTENLYNDIGQLRDKNVGDGIQTIHNEYNIRGWLTKVNDPNSLGNKLFGFELKYQNPDTSKSTPTAKYNGNISQLSWSTQNDVGIVRTYTYQYDQLNRLTSSNLWDQVNHDRGEYQENLTYDINGNIKSLYRTGKQISGFTSPEKMDDLEYYYENTDNSNKLSYLKEKVNGGNANSGYPLASGQQGQTIIYDDNGNMTTQADKGISSIAYNFLNLPAQVVQNGVTTQYVYRADGTKLKKSYGTGKVTDYLDGFQYELENGVAKLQFVPTSEGYYDFVKNLYIYNYVDHLGNTRLSYTKNSAGVLEILEENNYYPFGLKHSGYNNITGATPSYQYKYNGKELQETGMYDYGARFYMPDIGRWGVVDPLAEKHPNSNPMMYANNNPIIFLDPDGRDWYYTTDGHYEFNKSLTKDNAEQFFKDNNIKGAKYAFENNTMGSMYYGSNGVIYDDSAAGGGLPYESGKVKNIDEVVINTPKAIANRNIEAARSTYWTMVENSPSAMSVNNFNKGLWTTVGLTITAPLLPYLYAGSRYAMIAKGGFSALSQYMISGKINLFKIAGDMSSVNIFGSALGNAFNYNIYDAKEVNTYKFYGSKTSEFAIGMGTDMFFQGRNQIYNQGGVSPVMQNIIEAQSEIMSQTVSNQLQDAAKK